MNKVGVSACLLLLLVSIHFSAQESNELYSPSKNIKVVISFHESEIYYSAYHGEESIILPSKLGIEFEGNDTCKFFTELKYEHSSFDGMISPIWGQNSKIQNKYNELLLTLDDLRVNRKLNIRFRAYDDGFAFRYEYPNDEGSIVITSEETYVNLAGDYDSWWIWADYNTYEKLYSKNKVSECEHVAAPYTMRTSEGTHICILEADLENYSSMTLLKCDDDSTKFKVNLAPWADDTKVKTSGPFKTPWRCFVVAEDAAGLLESDLVFKLNDEAEQRDYSWIKPITYVGIWWEMHLGISEWGISNNRHGATTENTKKYIDFAAENNIDAVLVEGWNTGWEDWGKPNAFDFVTPYPDFDIYEVVRYAKEKGVEIIGHHETGGDIIAYEESLDEAFSFYHDLGIKYVKTGYAGAINPPEESHHGQYMVNHYNKVMKAALEYEIMLDVHEPVIPSGLARTYPNLMSFEGVRGMEWNAWSDGNPPSHTCIIPFTRGIAGPIDYTPGIFNIHQDNFEDKRKRWNSSDTLITSTHSTISNQIALMVVLYSPMQMAADMIENYYGHQAFEFVKEIPATWDETKILNAEIGEYIVIARRSGDKWFVAGITNEDKRRIFIKFDTFLEDGKVYETKILKDHLLAHYKDNPEKFLINQLEYNSNQFIEIQMKEGGGFLMIFELSGNKQ